MWYQYSYTAPQTLASFPGPPPPTWPGNEATQTYVICQLSNRAHYKQCTRGPGTGERGPEDPRIFSWYGRQKCNYKPKLMVISSPGVCKSAWHKSEDIFSIQRYPLACLHRSSSYQIFVYLVLRPLRRSQTPAHYTRLQKKHLTFVMYL